MDSVNLLKVVIGGEVTRTGQALGVNIEPIWGFQADEFAKATTMTAVQKLKAKVTEVLNKQFLPTEELEKKVGTPQRPSLLQDIIKKRRTEVEFLNGEVVRRGKVVGVATPMNQALLDLTLKIENGKAEPSPANIELLKKKISL